MFMGDSGYSGMSDSELDDLYAQTFDSYKSAIGLNKTTWSAALSNIALEIVDRLSSVRSFITGAFGATRFPKYDSIIKANPVIGGFQQVATAQSSLKSSAENVAAGLKWGIGGAVALGVSVSVLLAIIRKGK